MGLRVGGLASGIDTGALIDALMSLERRPLQLVQQRKTQLESRRDLFRDLNAKLVALRDAAAAIDNLSSGLASASTTEEFLAFSATSSHEAILTATASSAAVPGSTQIVVDALAQPTRHVSASQASDIDPLPNSANRFLRIDHAGPNQIDIQTGAGGVSLRDLADLINTDPNNGGEVRADVIFDGSGYRLIIAGTSPGVVNDVSVSSNIGQGNDKLLDDSLSVSATDARLTAFGLSITRPDNSITDLIPGVSLELKSAAPGTTINVQVSRDDDEIEAKIQAFVDAYNETMDFVIENARYDATAKVAGPLVGDATIRGIEQRIQRTVVESFGFTDNPFGSLAQIGMRLEKDGRLKLDSDVLRTALSTDAGSVRQLLSGDGVTDGAAVAIARMIDPIVDTDAKIGTLAIRNAGFGDRIDSLEQQIERLEARLVKREELLVLRFSQMETVLAQLQNQGNSLSSLVLPERRR